MKNLTTSSERIKALQESRFLDDKTEGQLFKRIEDDIAKGDDSLLNSVMRRVEAAENYKGPVIIMEDIKDYSFYFVHYNKDVEFVMNGGIVFHGSHDGGGNGSAPTFSVNITPQNGWSTHT